jgi:hypothetical protein
VGFDELAELLLSVDVLTGMGVTSGVLAIAWYLRRQWEIHRKVRERETLVEERRQREASARRDVEEWQGAQNLDVYLNGMLLLAGDDYTVDASNEDDPALVFPTPLRPRDVIQFHTRNSRRVLTIEEGVSAGTSVRLTPANQSESQADEIVRLLRQIRTNTTTDDWVRLPSPDIGLRAGDPIEYQGGNYWIKDIRQDFNPGGHYTYVRLEPFEKAEDVGKPRTRYERMLDEEDWD